MPVLDVLQAELATGLPRLTGTRVIADVPVRQTVLDQVLPLLPGVPPDVRVDIGVDRQVQLRYGVFHANGRLAPRLTGDNPVLTFELASQLVAWGLQRLSLPPFVRVSGRLVHVHLTRVPGLVPMAPLWRHLESLTFTSVPGRLDVRMAIHVLPERH